LRSRRARPGTIRALSLAAAACSLLAIATLYRLLLVAAHVGLLASRWMGWLVEDDLAARVSR